MFDFQKFIQRTLIEKSLSQTALAKAVGVTRQQVVLWLAGQGDPGDEACYALERLMGLEAQTLVLHKKLNRIEALGLDLPKMVEPELLKHHGIIPVPNKPKAALRGVLLDAAPHNPDAAHAAALAERGAWAELTQWAASKITS